MKTKSPLILILLLSVCLSMVSCVSKKKYRSSRDMISKLQSDSMNTHGQLKDCYVQVQKLEGDKAALQDANSSVQDELMSVSSQSKMTIADQAKRLKSLQGLIQAQRDVMLNLKKSIADALVGFKADELAVYIKDGKVYVSLEEKLLFKSGSAVVDPKGKEALQKLATVLNNTKDIAVLIEGHTDNKPIKTAKFEDNWTLSSERSLSIVRLLTKDYGFDSKRITASGRGEFHPVASNDTDETRAANRRTEIILTPNLMELYKLLDL